MTTISIENMEFYAYHGCYEQEQTVGNRFRVDLTFTTDTTVAETSDSIHDTVSYLEVYQTIAKEIAIKSHLLENVAKRMLDAIGAKFPEIMTATLKVSKLTPPLGGVVDSVGVTLTRKYH